MAAAVAAAATAKALMTMAAVTSTSTSFTQRPQPDQRRSKLLLLLLPPVGDSESVICLVVGVYKRANRMRKPTHTHTHSYRETLSHEYVKLWQKSAREERLCRRTDWALGCSGNPHPRQTAVPSRVTLCPSLRLVLAWPVRAWLKCVRYTWLNQNIFNRAWGCLSASLERACHKYTRSANLL